MRFLQQCLFVGITTLAAAPALRAQVVVSIPCNGAPVGETYCYVNNDDHSWHWQSECGSPINLLFDSGNIESNFDDLRIYDGPDDASPLLYQNVQEDLSGLQFTGNSGDLFMQFNSNATNCCATDGFRDTGWQWAWSLSSGSVGIQEEQAGNFMMYPNPATSELHMRLSNPTNGPAEIRILDVTGREVYRNSISATGAELNTFHLNALQNGNYSVMLTTPSWVKTRKLQVMR